MTRLKHVSFNDFNYVHDHSQGVKCQYIVHPRSTKQEFYYFEKPALIIAILEIYNCLLQQGIILYKTMIFIIFEVI